MAVRARGHSWISSRKMSVSPGVRAVPLNAESWGMRVSASRFSRRWLSLRGTQRVDLNGGAVVPLGEGADEVVFPTWSRAVHKQSAVVGIFSSNLQVARRQLASA